MALSRIEILVKLNELLYDRELDDSSFSLIQDKMFGFLEGNINSEEITIWINNDAPNVVNCKMWMDDIRHKPIYNTMKKYVNGELKSNEEIAKMTSSIITQLIIRKQLYDEFNYKIMGANELINIMYDYMNNGEINKDLLLKWIIDHTDLKRKEENLK